MASNQSTPSMIKGTENSLGNQFASNNNSGNHAAAAAGAPARGNYEFVTSTIPQERRNGEQLATAAASPSPSMMSSPLNALNPNRFPLFGMPLNIPSAWNSNMETDLNQPMLYHQMQPLHPTSTANISAPPPSYQFQTPHYLYQLSQSQQSDTSKMIDSSSNNSGVGIGGGNHVNFSNVPEFMTRSTSALFHQLQEIFNEAMHNNINPEDLPKPVSSLRNSFTPATLNSNFNSSASLINSPPSSIPTVAPPPAAPAPPPPTAPSSSSSSSSSPPKDSKATINTNANSINSRTKSSPKMPSTSSPALPQQRIRDSPTIKKVRKNSNSDTEMEENHDGRGEKVKTEEEKEETPEGSQSSEEDKILELDEPENSVPSHYLTRKQQIHNESERKRQQNIKNGIEKLRKLVPGCAETKTSKAKILERSAKYLEALKKEVKRVNDENKSLKSLFQNPALADLLVSTQQDDDSELDQNYEFKVAAADCSSSNSSAASADWTSKSSQDTNPENPSSRSSSSAPSTSQHRRSSQLNPRPPPHLIVNTGSTLNQTGNQFSSNLSFPLSRPFVSPSPQGFQPLIRAPSLERFIEHVVQNRQPSLQYGQLRNPYGYPLVERAIPGTLHQVNQAEGNLNTNTNPVPTANFYPDL